MLLAVLLLSLRPAITQLKYRGNDVSFIPQIESLGGVYRDHGQREDPFRIYAKHGLNLARIRVWVNPKDGWCSPAQTLALAKRATKAGLKLLIDFHYSDTWADPGHQPKPAAWLDIHGAELEKRVYDHTYAVVHALVQQGTAPEIAQVGNEVRVGMLWPDGKLDGTDGQWRKFAGLYNAGCRAVVDASKPKAFRTGKAHPIRLLLHTDSGGDVGASQYFFDHAVAAHMPFDLIGLSYYPWWHGTLENLKANLENLSTRYRRGIFVVETAYPFTLDPMSGGQHMVGDASKLLAGFPASQAGQAAFLRAETSLMLQVPRVEGLVYWAADWLGVKPDMAGGENLALFDGSGEALPGLDALAGT